jgi:addiction module HigA family antidote
MATEYPREEVKRPPIHPGVIFAEDVMPELRKTRTIGEVATLLGVSRQNLYRVMSGEVAMTPDMAVRLGKLCGNGAGVWLRLQASYDEWEASRRLAKEIAKIPTVIG